ncbi:MAG: DUF5702 domain-containing protein [Lachnospiraceae bacterium]|nr:DUF5702 domain-containing protein [Lachnospiraceae bacterium]
MMQVEGKKKRKEWKASITIYLTLMLVLVMALICTLVESGRVSAINSKLRSITYMSVDSCFAEFAEPLFSQYGVMFLWNDENEFIEKFNNYVTQNLTLAGTAARNDLVLYRMNHEGSELTDITWATDDDGKVFADQVEEYMKYHVTQTMIQKILSDIGIFEQSDQISGFMDQVQRYKDIFVKVEKSVSNISDKIDKAKNLAQNPKNLLHELMESVEGYEQEGNEKQVKEFHSQISELEKTKNKLTEYLEDINEETETYYSSVAEAKEAVGYLETELKENETVYDKEVYKVVEEELQDIKTKSADTDADYYHVVENANITNGYIQKLNELDGLIEDGKAGLTPESAASLKSEIAEYETMFSDFNLDQLGVNFESLSVDQESDDFLTAIADLFEGGVMKFIAGELSEKITDLSDVPSKTVAKGKIQEDQSLNGTEEEDKESLLDVGINKGLFSEYVIEFFGNKLEGKKNTALDYETEYIISGKKSDKENLESVINRIIIIRMGLNYISLLKDPAKKSETYALATSIIGFTGQPLLIKIMQLLIMSAWTMAESMIDVKVLLEGKKIATLKSGDDWNLSLEGLKNFAPDSIEGTDSKKGMGYEDYLRLLLLMENRTKLYFRTMDMIQANMCKNENENFRFKDSMQAVKITATYNSPRLFVLLPMANNALKVGDGGYQFSIQQEYAY